LVRELVKTTIISERIQKPEKAPPLEQDAPQALEIREELQYRLYLEEENFD